MSDVEDVRAVYVETCRSHDGIVNFRSKLLAFLPTASGTGILLLLGSKSLDPLQRPLLLPVGVFGALITLGLFIHELRGIETCHGLIKSAQELEQKLLGKLGDFGPFTFKPGDVGGVIGTTGAALVIYPTVIGAWVYIAGIGLLNSFNPGVSESVLKVAAGVTVGFMFLGLVVHLSQEKRLERKANRIKASRTEASTVKGTAV